jgi:hypothetical protein
MEELQKRAAPVKAPSSVSVPDPANVISAPSEKAAEAEGEMIAATGAVFVVVMIVELFAEVALFVSSSSEVATMVMTPVTTTHRIHILRNSSFKRAFVFIGNIYSFF